MSERIERLKQLITQALDQALARGDENILGYVCEPQPEGYIIHITMGPQFTEQELVLILPDQAESTPLKLAS